jgi:hypothetical protein
MQPDDDKTMTQVSLTAGAMISRLQVIYDIVDGRFAEDA